MSLHLSIFYPCPYPPPCCSPLVTTTSLFSVSVSLLHLPGLFYFLILHINGIIQHLSSSLSHISDNIMPSNQSMFLKMAKVHSFLWLSNIPLCVCGSFQISGFFFFFIFSSNLKVSWAPKNWCFWTVLLEKTLESPLDYKEIQPVHSEGDQPWDFFGRSDAKAETPILWPPHVKSWLIGKVSDAGRDWGQEEKGRTEGEMAGWHHRLHGCESEWTAGVGDGQGGLACCNSWGRKELDTTEWLNCTESLFKL